MPDIADIKTAAPSGAPPPATAGARLSRRLPSDVATYLLLAVVAPVLLWFVLYPNIYVFIGSLIRQGRFTLANYAEFFSSSAEIEAVTTSILISIGSVILSGLIGVPLAFIFTRYDFPGRKIFGALASLPVLLPPLVGVIAFMFLYGESGIFTRSVQNLFGLSKPPFSLSGVWAILLVHAYSMYVYFYMFVSAGLERLSDVHSEAAASLGASRFYIFRRVTLPMLGPSLIGASLLVFMTSMASFSAPFVFGGGVRVLSIQILSSKLNGDLELALVETVVLASVSILFLFLLRWYEGKREYIAGTKGAAIARQRVRSPLLRYAIGVIGILLVIILLLPHLTIILISFVKDGAWTTQTLPPEYTLDNYLRLFADRQFSAPIKNSILMSLAATAANLVWGLVAAYLVARKRFFGRAAIEALLILPWALPGTVLALSLAETFSRNRFWAGQFVLVGTFWILPLAYFIRNIPLVVRAIQASFKQLDPALEDASANLGASWFYTMRRVVLPLVLPGALVGSLLALVTAVGEFVASIVIYTYNNRPISVEILSQLRQFNFGSAAAYGTFLIAIIAAMFLITQLLLRRDPSKGVVL